MYHTSLIILKFSAVSLNDYTEPETTTYLCSTAAPGKPLHKRIGFLTLQKTSIKNKTDNRFMDSTIHLTTVTPLTAIQVYSGFFGATISFTHFRSF